METQIATVRAGADAAQDLSVKGVAARPGLERIETVVTIPADFQYAIKRWNAAERREEFSVGLKADAYDYLNRVVGVTFFLPPVVHDEASNERPNPIHRPDYIYLRQGAVWYTPLGQLVGATEDVEVNYRLVYQDARINAKSAEVLSDEHGMPQFDQNGNPVVRLNKDDELKALRTLSKLRSFGPRYVQTVARVRLLKLAIGIRSLPIDRPQNFPVRVVGYRDQMTPQERVEEAEQTATAMFGRPDDTQPLSHDELNEVAPALEDTEEIDRQLIDGRPADDDSDLPDIPDAKPSGGAAEQQGEALWPDEKQ